MSNRYAYNELREKALSSNATKEDRLALLEWCDEFFYTKFNGEFYSIGDGLRLYPIHNEIEEDVFELVDAEIC